jgi:hypothetical protein
MRLILSLALIVAAGHPVWADGKCPDFRFRAVQSLSIQNLGRLSEDKNNPPGGIRVLWFDHEDRPWLGKRPAIALMLARTGDLAETPVAGILYSNAPMRLESNRSSKNDASSAAVFAAEDKELSCPTFRFSMQPDGRVTADSIFIGQVK